MQRLFAIDMKNALDGRLEIAWVYNFENLDPVLPLVSENRQEKWGTSEENRVDSTYDPAFQIMVKSNLHKHAIREFTDTRERNKRATSSVQVQGRSKWNISESYF